MSTQPRGFRGSREFSAARNAATTAPRRSSPITGPAGSTVEVIVAFSAATINSVSEVEQGRFTSSRLSGGVGDVKLEMGWFCKRLKPKLDFPLSAAFSLASRIQRASSLRSSCLRTEISDSRSGDFRP
ncbi:hypothetical protein C9890_0047 [Perkinsus sp. BL_2016]|nr:hypothetical protein C9890_0047 [Perkinsus sp. BL_2016]